MNYLNLKISLTHWTRKPIWISKW